MERGDVYDRMTDEEYIKTVERAGFKIVLKEDFKDRYGKDNCLFVLWHEDGILLKIDTFTWNDERRTLNSADIYYNILVPRPLTSESWSSLGGGGFHWTGPITPDDRNCTDIWVGYQDAREALLYKLERLKEAGTFLKEWVDSNHVYLTHYMDVGTEEKDWQVRTKLLREAKIKRLNSLPKEVGSML